jgi:centrosomal protein CEP41
MERKVPKNDKFAHIPGRLDTGLTVAKVKFITAQEFAKRRNEIFFRLSKGQLYQLYGEYEAVENESMNDCYEYGGMSSPKIVTYSEDAEAINVKPYLIFDVREPEDYLRCHLLHARTYPFTMMRRDKVHPELFNFKNKPETLIIIYCDDEKMSADAAKLLVDRGADNIFLLTGGRLEFGAVYPSFVEGELPAACMPKKEVSTARRTGKYSIDYLNYSINTGLTSQTIFQSQS